MYEKLRERLNLSTRHINFSEFKTELVQAMNAIQCNPNVKKDQHLSKKIESLVQDVESNNECDRSDGFSVEPGTERASILQDPICCLPEQEKLIIPITHSNAFTEHLVREGIGSWQDYLVRILNE